MIVGLDTEVMQGNVTDNLMRSKIVEKIAFLGISLPFIQKPNQRCLGIASWHGLALTSSVAHVT